MRRLVLLLTCLLLLAGCRTDEIFGEEWKRGSPEDHAVLNDGVQLVRWTRGKGKLRESRYELFVKGADVEIDSVDELVPHCRDLLDLETAIAYSDLVRKVGLEDVPVTGDVILPDPIGEGPGGSGTYTHHDAGRWGVEFGAQARKYAGGVEVTVVVLYSPQKHPDLKYYSPYRLVRLKETVYPDGTISPGETKTLTNGEDAQRFDIF